MNRLLQACGAADIDELIDRLQDRQKVRRPESREQLEVRSARRSLRRSPSSPLAKPLPLRAQASVDFYKLRGEDLRRVSRELNEQLVALKFTGEGAASGGYVLFDSATGELEGYGGSPEVTELGARCVSMRAKMATVRRRCTAAENMVAQSVCCIGTMLRASAAAVSDDAKETAAPPSISPDQAANALAVVMQRLAKILAEKQSIPGFHVANHAGAERVEFAEVDESASTLPMAATRWKMAARGGAAAGADSFQRRVSSGAETFRRASGAPESFRRPSAGESLRRASGAAGSFRRRAGSHI